MVGCIRRQLQLPFLEQPGAQLHDHDQDQQGDAERHELACGSGGMGRQVAQAPAQQTGAGEAPAHGTQTQIYHAGGGEKCQCRCQQYEKDIREILEQQPQQRQLGSGRQTVDQPDGQWQGTEIAMQYSQWRRAGEAQHRGQGETRHQQKGRAPGREPGFGPRFRQRHGHQGSENLQYAPVGAPAQPGGQYRRRYGEHQKLVEVQLDDIPVASPQTAQHGAHVEVALAVAAGGEANGNGGQRNGQQGGDADVIGGPLQRFGRCAIAAGGFLQFVTGSQGIGQLLAQCVDGAGIAVKKGAVADTAARSQHLRRFQVGGVDHHPGSELEQAGALVRLERQDAVDPQRSGAEIDFVAHRRVQLFQHPGVHPGGPGFRNALQRGGARSGFFLALELPQQGVFGRNRLDAAKLHGLAVEQHRLEAVHQCCGQSQFPARLPPCGIRLPGAFDHQIPADQFRGLLRQGPLQTIGDQGDGEHGTDGDHQRREQHGQLAGTPVPAH